jgi:hypothetical protein
MHSKPIPCSGSGSAPGWHSILVVNIGHPGDHPWLDRLPRLEYHEAVRHA